MADFGRGIKAGVAAASIYLFISVILKLTGLYGQFSSILWPAGLYLDSMPLKPTPPLVFEWAMLGTVVLRIGGGIVFGAIFAALCNYLPGIRGVVKGVVLAAFLWIFETIASIYMFLGWPNYDWAGVTWWGGVVAGSSMALVLTSVVSTVIFGALAGLIWDRPKAREVMGERKGMPVLLVSCIVGGLRWATSAITYSSLVLSGVAPFPLGTDWWDILMLLTMSVGAAGWVLTFIAWRRTRAGESGLRLGVTGGVLMVVTCFMLTFGALAIAGGVLSRRKPAIESANAEIVQQR